MVGVSKPEDTGARRGQERGHEGPTETTWSVGILIEKEREGKEPETARAGGFGQRGGKGGDQFRWTMRKKFAAHVRGR